MRIFDTKKRKARRALTVYFATAEAKRDFDTLAEGFGMSSSTLGMLLLHAGMRQGFKAISGDLTLSGSPANVVNSQPQNPDQGASTARKRIRPKSR